MPIDSTTWYDPDPDPASIYQGDLLVDVPVVLMPPAGDGPWIVLRPSLPLTLEDALAGNVPKIFRPHAENAPLVGAWAGKQELVLAKGIKTPILVVTQTCDIERRRFIHVAPVYGIEGFDQRKIESLTANEIQYWFYLPDHLPLRPAKQFADLSQIVPVHNSYLRRARRLERLTPLATTELQKKLASFHGRPFGFNTRDTVPQEGDYLCARCFYVRAQVTRRAIAAGQQFPACEQCGADVLWVKFVPLNPSG